MSRLEEFFDGKWNDKIFKYKNPIFLISLMWAVLVITFAGQIKPEDKPMNFLKDDAPFQSIINLFTDVFP